VRFFSLTQFYAVALKAASRRERDAILRDPANIAGSDVDEVAPSKPNKLIRIRKINFTVFLGVGARIARLQPLPFFAMF
jgi:hypothetical protein